MTRVRLVQLTKNLIQGLVAVAVGQIFIPTFDSSTLLVFKGRAPSLKILLLMHTIPIDSFTINFVCIVF